MCLLSTLGASACCEAPGHVIKAWGLLHILGTMKIRKEPTEGGPDLVRCRVVAEHVGVKNTQHLSRERVLKSQLGLTELIGGIVAPALPSWEVGAWGLL